MEDLFSYPHQPGFKKAGTSSEAAASIAPRAPTIKHRILESMAKGYAWTPDKFAAAHGLGILSVRPRFSELLKTGKIVETGRTSTNDSGKRADVYCAPQFKHQYEGTKQ